MSNGQQDADDVREARKIVRTIVTAFTGYHTDTAELARLIVTGLDAHGLLRGPLSDDCRFDTHHWTDLGVCSRCDAHIDGPGGAR